MMALSEFPSKTVQVIFFNVKQDDYIREGIELYLDPLIRNRCLHTWSIGNVTPGGLIEAEIMAHLEIAHLILILVSPNFVASDYIDGKEMDKCMQMHQKDVRVVPVIVWETNWKSCPFKELSPLMGREGKPIRPGRNKQDAIIQVATKIQQIIEEIALKLESQVSESSGLLSSDIYSSEIEFQTNSQNFRPLLEDINQMSRKIQLVNSDEYREKFFRWLKNSPDHMNRLQMDMEVMAEFQRQFSQGKGGDYEGE